MTVRLVRLAAISLTRGLRASDPSESCLGLDDSRGSYGNGLTLRGWADNPTSTRLC
jgi:hypothetical protein